MSPSFKEELRAELVAAARRQHAARARRRRWSGIAAAAALLFVVLAGAQVVLTPPHAAADILIEVHGDRIEVRLLDTDNSLEALRTELRDAGIDVTVEPGPVGPSNEGLFVGLVVDRGDAEGIHRLGVRGPGFVGFSLPVDWDGRFTLFYGLRAGDEPYQVPSIASFEGEPLHCVPALGGPLAEVALPPGVEASVMAHEPPRAGDAVPLAEALDLGLGDWIVVVAFSWQRGSVQLHVTSDGTPIVGDLPPEELDPCSR